MVNKYKYKKDISNKLRMKNVFHIYNKLYHNDITCYRYKTHFSRWTRVAAGLWFLVGEKNKFNIDLKFCKLNYLK